MEYYHPRTISLFFFVTPVLSAFLLHKTMNLYPRASLVIHCSNLQNQHTDYYCCDPRFQQSKISELRGDDWVSGSTKECQVFAKELQRFGQALIKLHNHVWCLLKLLMRSRYKRDKIYFNSWYSEIDSQAIGVNHRSVWICNSRVIF
jgi:hypothetical protein